VHIPRPKLYPCPPDMIGMTSLEQVKFDFDHAPTFELAEDWVIDLGFGYSIIIPCKFKTDFASIPRSLWPLIEPHGPLCIPSLPHDFRYQYGYFLTTEDTSTIYSDEAYELRESFPVAYKHLIPVLIEGGQEMSDMLLKNMAVFISGATVQAEEAYTALRIFGSIAWKNYRYKGPDAYNENSLGLPGVVHAH
jgi:hypothetical protein